MMTMIKGYLSLWLLFITSSKILPAVHSKSTVTGKPHSTVQDLTEDNFDEALNDPANGLWLLKFYGKLNLRSRVDSNKSSHCWILV